MRKRYLNELQLSDVYEACWQDMARDHRPPMVRCRPILLPLLDDATGSISGCL